MLISTQPNSKGKAAAIARSRQLTDFCWTPLCDVPTYTKKDGKTVHAKGSEVVGFPYASQELNDKFLCENVSVGTFLSCLDNPDSVLYQKDNGGRLNSWTYYGIVCNGLVRYALGIKRRISTKRWLDIPGMRKILDAGKYTAEDIELCDVLYAFGEGRNHVSLITDLLRDENGKVAQIEVSEAIRPSCKRARYDLETYFEKFKLFSLCRYDYIDTVPDNDPEIDKLLFETYKTAPKAKLFVDNGNKSNYLASDEVLISSFEEGENEIEIYRDEKLIDKITLAQNGKIARVFEKGYYTLKNSKTGETTGFCVNEPKISHTADNGVITIKAESGDVDSEILYMDFREEGTDCASLSAVIELSEKEKKTGFVRRNIPSDAANFKVYFKNKYGVWTHRMMKIGDTNS